MANFLIVTPLEIKQRTIVGGNVDDDKINYAIDNVQMRVILPLLGSELYDKLITDFKSNTLAGLYETIYNEYVKPITLQESTAEFIEINSFIVNNGGNYKHQADNSQVLDKEEVLRLSNKYHSNAQVYIDRLEKFLCKNNIPEYKTIQDEVNANRSIKTTSGWYL